VQISQPKEIVVQVLVNLLNEKMLQVGAAFSLINFFRREMSFTS
jgi:hypothetical protein